MIKEPCICVFCKKCNKPFSVSLANDTIVGVDLTKENAKYKKKDIG